VEGLAELYSQALMVIVDAPKSGGQLVLCLPDQSYTGRAIPFFTHELFVQRQIQVIAERLGREVTKVPVEPRQPRASPEAPYYWESERALRRAILHLRITDLPNSSETNRTTNQ